MGSCSLLSNSSQWLSTYNYRIMDVFRIICKTIYSTITIVTAYYQIRNGTKINLAIAYYRYTYIIIIIVLEGLSKVG